MNKIKYIKLSDFKTVQANGKGFVNKLNMTAYHVLNSPFEKLDVVVHHRVDTIWTAGNIKWQISDKKTGIRIKSFGLDYDFNYEKQTRDRCIKSTYNEVVRVGGEDVIIEDINNIIVKYGHPLYSQNYLPY